MNPLLLPPRLLARALDDLHAIAEAARLLPTIEATLIDRFEALERRADAIEDRLERVLEMGDGIDAQAGAIVALGERFDPLGHAILAQGGRIEESAREVAERGAQLVEALPMLQRAVDLTQPLEGAVERLGRFVDRLPGGARGARPPGGA